MPLRSKGKGFGPFDGDSFNNAIRCSCLDIEAGTQFLDALAVDGVDHCFGLADHVFQQATLGNGDSMAGTITLINAV